MARVPISFEFFPPKTDEQRAQLDRTVERLKPHAPEFVSCTFGAGGSTLGPTGATVQRLQDTHRLEAVPHMTCVGGASAEIKVLLRRYRSQGHRRIVALRGDLPSGMGNAGELGHAADLVRLIRSEHDDHFRIDVAAYPEMHPHASDAFADLRHFKAKVDAGADGAITQYFYNVDAYFRFVDDVRRLGVTVPIVPGIMPISNYAQLRRFSESCGAEIPRWIDQRMRAHGDDVDAVREFAADLVVSLCWRLIQGGAPALHFFTLNLSRPTLMVLSRL